MFLAKIKVTLKPTVNDPQGQTVLGALKTLGFATAQKVRVGKYIEVYLDESDRRKAEEQVKAMSDKLLANPVIESFSFDLEEGAAKTKR
ncbi:MAG: phosphoribosylformylglycinamidine synthase subunit PurS [SAR202 cluster bacterium]|nr:phosphoribosylformylglycinamidine synthase subunit PurS [SAR202 cluster bacterium]